MPRDEEKYKDTLFDQTEPEWLEVDNPSGLGTGLFLYEDEREGKGFVPDLTYDECKQQAEEAICFRWIPHAIISYEDLMCDNYESG